MRVGVKADGRDEQPQLLVREDERQEPGTAGVRVAALANEPCVRVQPGTGDDSAYYVLTGLCDATLVRWFAVAPLPECSTTTLIFPLQ